MTSQQKIDWAKLRELFDRAQHLAPDAREALLQRPDLDAELVAELRSLLSHSDAVASEDAAATRTASAFLSAPASDALAGAVAAQGKVLGAWRLVAPLGAGGMGEVWLAERADGRYEGKAAVKLLKRGMDSQSVLQRFALEQQALARLNHPNIARLLDAGLSEESAPYFVMEWVQDSQAIDRACQGKSLPKRLAMFLQLADAVSHAHRKLLVHRDLKPGNVMVNAEGQVKLLDFGIAKALSAESASATQLDQQPFTPQYASPEQVRGEPVSTATDLYSLGVLLYVMLTGQRPYGRNTQDPRAAALAVLEEAPTRPSSVAVPEPGWEATRRQLEGDLDNILLKALEKDVDERYASVDAFAADIRAYLGGFPVSARPASGWYVLRKFVARNPWGTLVGGLGVVGLASGLAASVLSERAALGLGVVGLAVGMVLALLQARQATLARDAANAARDAATAAKVAAQERLSQIKRMTADLVFRHGDAVNLLPGGSASQEQLLNETVAGLLPMVDALPDDGDLLAMAASAVARLAEIQGNTVTAAPERASEAKATVARAADLGQRAWPSQKANWRFAQWHVRVRTVQAQLLRGEGELEAAVQVLRRAAAEAQESFALQTDAEGRVYMGTAVANADLLRGQIHDHVNLPNLGQPTLAIEALQSAKAVYESMLAQSDLLARLDAEAPAGSPSSFCYLRHQIGTTLGARALILLRQNNGLGALEVIEQAVVIRKDNVAREGHVVPWRDGLMVESNTWSQALLLCGRPEEALIASELAHSTAAALATEEGPNSKWAGVGSMLSVNATAALMALGRFPEARELVDANLPQLEGKLSEAPNDAVLAQRVARMRAMHDELQGARSTGSYSGPV